MYMFLGMGDKRDSCHVVVKEKRLLFSFDATVLKTKCIVNQINLESFARTVGSYPAEDKAVSLCRCLVLSGRHHCYEQFTLPAVFHCVRVCVLVFVCD